MNQLGKFRSTAISGLKILLDQSDRARLFPAAGKRLPGRTTVNQFAEYRCERGFRKKPVMKCPPSTMKIENFARTFLIVDCYITKTGQAAGNGQVEQLFRPDIEHAVREWLIANCVSRMRLVRIHRYNRSRN
jgi:hypothetical protein